MRTNLKNSFLDLQKDQESKFTVNTEQKIKTSVSSNVGLLHFVGDIFELYLPKIFGLVVKMSGGGPSPGDHFNSPNQSSDNDYPKYPNTTN